MNKLNCVYVYLCVYFFVFWVCLFLLIYIKKEIWGFIEIYGFIFELVKLNEVEINKIYFF